MNTGAYYKILKGNILHFLRFNLVTMLDNPLKNNVVSEEAKVLYCPSILPALSSVEHPWNIVKPKQKKKK